MAAHSGSSSSVPSLPPPCPKSPPEYPDLYGKRRELAKVQVLEREISFLEEELKTVDRFHPASRSCKEVADFVVAKSDPLIPKSEESKVMPLLEVAMNYHAAVTVVTAVYVVAVRVLAVQYPSA
ncbi:hypothetical protein CUMW_030720, partial [Citrus unshiu]